MKLYTTRLVDLAENCTVALPASSGNTSEKQVGLGPISGVRLPLRVADFASGTTLQYVFDMGSNFATKNFQPDTVLIEDISRIVGSGGTSLQVDSSPDGTTWTNLLLVNLAAGGFLASLPTDRALSVYAGAIPAHTARRYYRVSIIASVSLNLQTVRRIWLDQHVTLPYPDIANIFYTFPGQRTQGRHHHFHLATPSYESLSYNGTLGWRALSDAQNARLQEEIIHNGNFVLQYPNAQPHLGGAFAISGLIDRSSVRATFRDDDLWDVEFSFVGKLD